jgi:hypothetical protein
VDVGEQLDLNAQWSQQDDGVDELDVEKLHLNTPALEKGDGPETSTSFRPSTSYGA